MATPFGATTGMEATSTETTSVPDFNADWEAWKQTPTQEGLHSLVKRLDPVITSALRPLGPLSPVVKGRARLVAAKAIKSYDPSLGAKLPTFVASHMRTIIRDAPAIQDPIPMPTRQRQELHALTTASDSFSEQFGRDPSDEEMASVMGMPVKKVIKLRSGIRARIPMSVHDEQDEDGEGHPDIAASAHRPFDDWQDAVYHGLGDVDKVIFMHRTGYRSADKLSNNEIAKKTGLSPQVVSSRARRLQAELDSFNG